MSIRTEAHVWLETPVLQVVPRFITGHSEIRYLVPMDPAFGQELHGVLIQRRCYFVRRRVSGSITAAIIKNLEAEATFAVDFQHVNRDMRRVEARDPFERIAPACLCLEWESRNQIDI